jgi:opacity protein-like surface antigen
LCLLLTQTPVLASTPMSGPYVRGFGGFAFPTSGNVNINLFSNPEYKTGYDAGAQIGYKSGPIRYEFEGAYARVKLNKFSYNGTTQTSASGKSSSASLILNVYYDFEDFSASLAPYLGVGVGYAHIVNTLESTSPSNVSFNKSDRLFASKANAGLTYNFSETFATDISYQYFRTKHSNKFNETFQSHLMNLGITYRYDN